MLLHLLIPENLKKKKKKKRKRQKSVDQVDVRTDVEKPEESSLIPENHKKNKKKRKHLEQVENESLPNPENQKKKMKTQLEQESLEQTDLRPEGEKPDESCQENHAKKKKKTRRKHSEQESVKHTNLGSKVENPDESLPNQESHNKKKKRKYLEQVEQPNESMPCPENHKKKKKKKQKRKHLDQESIQQTDLLSEVEKPDESLPNPESHKKKKKKRKHLEKKSADLLDFVIKTEKCDESLPDPENQPNHKSVEYPESSVRDTNLAQPTNLFDRELSDQSDSSKSNTTQEKMIKRRPLYPLINSIFLETPQREPFGVKIQSEKSKQTSSSGGMSSVKEEPVAISEVFDDAENDETERVFDLEKVKVEWKNPPTLKEAMAKVVAKEMKRKDSPYQNFRKGKIEKIYSNGDFIQNALQGALPFNIEDWESKPGLLEFFNWFRFSNQFLALHYTGPD